MQTFIRCRLPFIISRTGWTFGLYIRGVCLLEWLTFLPKRGILLHISHFANLIAFSVESVPITLA